MQFKDFFENDYILEQYQDKIAGNSGRGIDRMTTVSFERNFGEHLEIINRKCLDGSYSFSPYLEKLILKGRNAYPRVISIPTVRDKLVLHLLNLYLQNEYSDYVNRELPNARIRRLQKEVATLDIESLTISKLDISGFYDNINHEILFNMLDLEKSATQLLRKAVLNETVPQGCTNKNRGKFTPEKGVPQGLSISNILAELYGDEIDEAIEDECVFYDRYVDDILMISNDPKKLKKMTEKELSRLCLEFSEHKTNFSCTLDCPEDNQGGIGYLGYRLYNNARGDLVVDAKKQAIERFSRGISDYVALMKKRLSSLEQKLKGGNREELLEAFWEDINIKISGARKGNKRYGWVYYYSEISAVDTLYYLDAFIEKKLQEIPEFRGRTPKKLVRAYYSGDEYAHEYSENLSLEEKNKWLRARAIVPYHVELKENEISFLYKKYVGIWLKRLDQDSGKAY